MLDFRCDATDSRPIVGHGRALQYFAGSAVSNRRSNSGLADDFLLGGIAAAAMGSYEGRREGSATYIAP